MRVHLPDLRHELTLLVLSRYPLVVIEGSDEERLEELVREVASHLSLPLFRWSSTTGLVKDGGSRLADTRDPDRALARVLGIPNEVLAVFHDLHPYFERPEVLRRLREAERQFADGRSTLVITGVHVKLPSSLAAMATHLHLALPSLEELQELVRETARELSRQRRAKVSLKPEDVEAVAQSLKGLERGEARRLLYQAALRDGRLALEDLPSILKGKRRRVEKAGLLDWVDAVEGLRELGGLVNFKAWVTRRREAFTDAAQRFGLEPPRGVLLAGVPGAGKSLACRAVAGEWRLPLLRLDPGRLYDKYIGETEANLRRALDTAEAVAPAVLWIDEIEKALAAGSDATADGGVSQRVLGSLLTWMQERREQVFLMATANDIERLPVEAMRRGRFDEVFFVDLPDEESRQTIFRLHVEKRGRLPTDFDLERLAAASAGFSGAEIEGVVVAGLYHAFSDRCPLSTEILLAEIAATRPLSRLRPQKVAALRRWGRRHAVPA